MSEIIVSLDPTFVEINSAHPYDNQVNSEVMSIGVKHTNDISRVLISVPMDSIPLDAIITKAELKVYITTTSDKQNNIITPYMITSSWQEDEVSWHNRTKYDSNVYGTPVNIQYSGFTFFDVTNLVSRWHTQKHPNYGIILKNDEIGADCYAMMLYTKSKYEKPLMQIQYVLRCDSSEPITKFDEQIETLKAQYNYNYTKALDVSLSKTVACFIKNTGTSPILAKFQYSPNSMDYEDGSETKEIQPGKLLHTFPQSFSKYIRIGVRTKSEIEESKAEIWFQLQL